MAISTREMPGSAIGNALLIAFCAAGLSAVAQVPKANLDAVTFVNDGQSVRDEVIKFRIQAGIPIGSVANSNGPCMRAPSRNFGPAEATKVLDYVLSGSGYKWRWNGEVLEVVRESGLTPAESRVLGFKIEHFDNRVGAAIQGLWVVLAGLIGRVCAPVRVTLAIFFLPMRMKRYPSSH